MTNGYIVLPERLSDFVAENIDSGGSAKLPNIYRELQQVIRSNKVIIMSSFKVETVISAPTVVEAVSIENVGIHIYQSFGEGRIQISVSTLDNVSIERI